MAVITLTKEELRGIQEISGLLRKLSKIVGEDELNEIRFYDELATEKAAQIRAQQRQSVVPKSEIEKFM